MGKMNGTALTVVIAQIENTPAKADPCKPEDLEKRSCNAMKCKSEILSWLC
jgi:hypothetical protein